MKRYEGLVSEARKKWKKGEITHTQYWMCKHLANGRLIYWLKKGALSAQEIESNARAISDNLGVDYFYENKWLIRKMNQIGITEGEADQLSKKGVKWWNYETEKTNV